MRLPADARIGIVALGLTAALAGCSLIPGRGDRPAASAAASTVPASGPAADYPVVLGDPYTVDGALYMPADTMNYDAVGYAGIDAGAGVTVAHRTLPLPSYVEVTSLASGKTILARVERRGPMTGAQVLALSPAAAAQLGGGEGTPVRVRRVNPLESARAELRAGRAAAEPIATPKALVDALRRKLPASGAASLLAPVPARPAPVVAAAGPASPSAARKDLALPTGPAPVTAPVPTAVATAQPQSAKQVTTYPLPALARAPAAPAAPAKVVAQMFTLPQVKPAVSARPPVVQPAIPVAKPSPVASTAGSFVIQAGTFSNRANAQRVAEAIGGYVAPAGKYFRVRTGPFSNRGQADAALAKVRAAGYSDARVYTAG